MNIYLNIYVYIYVYIYILYRDTTYMLDFICVFFVQGGEWQW